MAEGPFPTFLRALKDRHGQEAAHHRHELYFQKRGLPGWFQAWLAAGRDAWLLGGQKQPRPLTETGPVALLVTTLAGASGWKTLARALPSIEDAGLTPVVLAHPRLPDDIFPDSLTILRPRGLPPLSTLLPGGLSPIAAAAARNLWWSYAIHQAVYGQTGRQTGGQTGHKAGVVICHNDFDMMSVAALRLGWPSLCLQHGLPTDEFFPCRADYQVVWGPSAAAAYQRAGCNADRIILDPVGRGHPLRPPPAPPQAIALISQSHARVFDARLPEYLQRLAQTLGHQAGVEFTVLLHPQEKDATPYHPLATSRTPHPRLFGPDAIPHLVIGYCSTMLIEAALAGHWVAGISLPLPGNTAALSLGQPPRGIITAEDALPLFHRLRKDATVRETVARDQVDWLSALFAPSFRQLPDLLRKIVPA